MNPTEAALPASGILRKVRIFLEMIKFEHSIFALPFAYLGLFLGAKGIPSFHLFLWVSVAMVSGRTLGMTLNRLIDHKIDAENPRTKKRALPAGLLTRGFSWFVVLLTTFIYFYSVRNLNPLCLKLSPIPVFLFWLYPYCKRWTWASHWFLGFTLGIAPYGGWLAVDPNFNWPAGLLLIAVTSWVGGFDIFYSLQDAQFDKIKGLHSLPAKFGTQKAIFIAKVSQGIMVLALGILGVVVSLGFFYWIGLFAVSAFIYREHQLISKFGLSKIDEAFFNMNAWVSVVIFLGTFLDLVARG